MKVQGWETDFYCSELTDWNQENEEEIKLNWSKGRRTTPVGIVNSVDNVDDAMPSDSIGFDITWYDVLSSWFSGYQAVWRYTHFSDLSCVKIW